MARTGGPTTGVERWVDAFWQHTGTGRPSSILPDGCIDFVFDLNRGSGWVVGPMSRAETCLLPVGARYFGVRFRPGAASEFLDAAARELLDRDAAFDEIGVKGGAELGERLAEASGDHTRRELISEFLLDPKRRCRALDARVERAVRKLQKDYDDVSIASLAKQVGLSERQLERLFHAHVGVRPKFLARVLRLQRAVTLSRVRVGTQAELATSAGFADEAHLLREFRALAGATPRALGRKPDGETADVGFVQDDDGVQL
jgi:AraC-like DNA-binding protein